MNFNRINIVSLTVLSWLAFTGCKKGFLDTSLNTAPTIDNVNSNYANLSRLARAPYGYLVQNRNEFKAIDGNLFAAVSDEAMPIGTSGDMYDFNNGSWNQFNNPDDRYNYYYAGIRGVNYFFEYLQQVGDYKKFLGANRDTITTTEKTKYYNDILNMQWYIAEAHILRAYFHFELAKRYGTIPLVTSTENVTKAEDVTVASFDNIVAFIVTEVDAYKDSLQANWKTSAFADQDGRLTKGVALALKSRALLFAASPYNNASGDVSKWQKAATALHDAVEFAQRTDDAGGRNSLAGDYGNYFRQNNILTSPETILALRYENDNDLEKANYPIATEGSFSSANGIAPSQNLVDAYESTGTPDPNDPYANRDPRLAYTIVTNNSNWNGRTIDQSPGGTDDMATVGASKTGYYLKKFLNDNVNLRLNGKNPRHWPVFRYAELLLEYAEAMNEAYGPDNANGYGLTAKDALNMVRNRPGVNMPPVATGDPAAFRTAVKHERQVELAFENYRYWDLRRWKDAAVVLNQPIHGVSVTKTGTGEFVYADRVVQNRVFDAAKMYLYPFPQAQVVISNGNLPQNPGW